MTAARLGLSRALPRATRSEWRLWLGTLLAVLGLAATVWAFQTQVERWIMRATFRMVRDEEPKRIDDRFVGRWIAPSGRILISRSAVVWFEAGDLIGTGSFDARVPNRFTFAGPGFRCTYDLTIRRDMSDWRLLEGTPGAKCPVGQFVRSFAY